METTNDLQMDATELLFDANAAVAGILKNSKLRMHYIKLVVMNNIMRAFVHLYKLDEKYITAQKELLRVLTETEVRKDRTWFKQDKETLVKSHTLYCELMESISNEELFELMQFVEQNQFSNDYIVTKQKSWKRLKTEVNRLLSL